MRHRTRRGVLATLVVAAVVVPFVGYSVHGSMPLVEDPGGMAAVGILGVLGVGIAFGDDAFRDARIGAVMAVLAVVGLAFGVVAVVVNSWALLVPMMAALVALWLVGLVEQAGPRVRPQTVRHG